MRIWSSVISITWIPSECVEGSLKLPFEMGVAHYDPPPPDALPDVSENLNALREADRFRFANELRAWIEVEDGKITGHGQVGKGHIGSTTLRLGPKSMTLAGTALPDRQSAVASEKSVRFTQTAGGRTAAPAPRKVKYAPYVQITAPLAWTTLTLTIHADGRSEHEVTGASPFPRHWIYDKDGKLTHKTGMVNFKTWYQRAFGAHTPWGDEDSPALVTEVESALERELSQHIMRGGKEPEVRRIGEGGKLAEEGEPGIELYLLLDGVLSVEVGGKLLTNLGPGAVLGERALLEGGKRTATLRAVTPVRVAAVSGDAVNPEFLGELAAMHRREET